MKGFSKIGKCRCQVPARRQGGFRPGSTLGKDFPRLGTVCPSLENIFPTFGHPSQGWENPVQPWAIMFQPWENPFQPGFMPGKLRWRGQNWLARPLL